MIEQKKIVEVLHSQQATSPAGKTGFAIMVGFVTGLVFWVCISDGDAQFTINLVRVMLIIGLMTFIYAVVLWLFKQWQGDRWNNQHWFPKTINFLLYAGHGFILSAITYEILAFAWLRT